MAGSTRAPSLTPGTDLCDVLGDDVDRIIRPAFLGYVDGATFRALAPNTARPLGGRRCGARGGAAGGVRCAGIGTRRQ
jgi:hypothetical protein